MKIQAEELSARFERLESFVRFFASELGISDMNFTLRIREDRSLKNKNLNGICSRLNDFYFVIRVKCFDDFASITEFFLTLAHELTHVMQFLKKNLSAQYQKLQKVSYYDRWYEKEAYELQGILVKKLVASI